MRRFVPVFASTSVLLGLGCSSGDAPGPNPERVAAREEAIVNGTPDTTHDAVVAIVGGSGQCSATVIAVVNGVGYGLTAGHCLSSAVTVLTGPNYNNPTAQYKVIGKKVHPLYKAGNAGSPYDFTVFKFQNAPANMATIPPLTAADDMMVPGTMLDLVGYGTILNMANNSKRLHIQVPIMEIGPQLIAFSGKPGGTCEGDSGGPAIVTVGGKEYVAGVTSYGVMGCNGAGVDDRVSLVTECFINAYIAGTTVAPDCGAVPSIYPPETAGCSSCVTKSVAAGGACAPAQQACMGSTECGDYSTCIGVCGETDSACYKQCATLYPTGATQLGAADDCICFQACPAECVVECNGPKGTCGFTPTDASCKTCLETSCCAEASACYGDPTCQMCQDATMPVGCDSNALSNAYNTCMAKSCAGPCMITPGSGAGGSGAGGGGAAGSGQAGANSAGGGTGTAGSGTAGSGTAGSVTGVAGSSAKAGSGGSTQNDANTQPAAASSGGCAIALGDRPISGLGWVAALGLALASRRRRAR